MPPLSLHGEGAVEPVVDNVQAGEGELGADLVGDAGSDGHLEERALLILDGDVRDWHELGHGVKRMESCGHRPPETIVMRVDHAAVVEIDEKGVSAAAYTDLGILGAGMPQKTLEFVLDRPFVFVVTGWDGSVLFTGVVRNIE